MHCHDLRAGKAQRGPMRCRYMPLWGLSLVVGAVCLKGPSVGIDALTDDQRHDSEVQGFEIISKGESEIGGSRLSAVVLLRRKVRLGTQGDVRPAL